MFIFRDDTALHFAAVSDGVDLTKILLDTRMCANLTNTKKKSHYMFQPHGTVYRQRKPCRRIC
jgi:hypothetical protein